MPSSSDVHSTTDLRTRWQQYQENHPNTYLRNAADDLGVSEVELLATGCGEHVTRLQGSWRALLGELEALGPVMALTRNDAAVHEKTGLYQNANFPEDSHVGLVLDDDIDLRLFLNHWHFGFAVEQETKAGTRHALQFFDADGTAVHKVYLTQKSDRETYERLVEKYRHRDQSPEQSVRPTDAEDEAAETPAAVDVEGFLDAWAELEDTHDFFPLLRDYDIDRTQALEVAEGRFTTPVPAKALRFTLQTARDGEVPIMVFVGNRGCLQIHSGPVKTLKETGPWYNVLDPGFNLHLNETMIDRAWVVEKPTSDGTVTSLELYEADGWPIARFFGKRKPGIPERDDWRAILDDLRA
jgi:putative hemin transport protein